MQGTKPLLIGFGHKARQGKNTAALALMGALPIAVDVRMCAFADALRKEVKHACLQCGGPGNLIEQFKEAGLMADWVHEEMFGKPRLLLQWWGTDYRRKQDADYWTKRLDKSLAVSPPDIALVTDVRFPNEAQFIKQRGGVLVQVIRTGLPDVQVHAHPSEQSLDGYAGWDYALKAANVAELKEKARALAAEIQRTHGSKF